MSTVKLVTKKLPSSIVCLILLFILLGGMGMVRCFSVLAASELIQEFAPSPCILYIAGSDLLWGITGAVSAAGLWIRPSWALTFAKSTGILIILTYWIDRFAFSQSPSDLANWPFSALLSAFFLGYLFWIASRPRTRDLYQKS